MNFRDLNAVRVPLLVLAAVLSVGAAAIQYTGALVTSAQGDVQRQRMALDDARSRYQRSGDEKDTIVKYLGTYEDLQRRGVVGEEQRINWIDALRLANIQADLFGIDYQIGVQEPYQYAEQMDPGGLKLRQSSMKLRFTLLHEGDLLRFLQILEEERAGLFTVNQCTITRLATVGSSPRYQPNLAAECDLTWITVSEESAKDKRA